jgi:glyceraldehyde 3-phosphate dehydrogenase
MTVDEVNAIMKSAPSRVLLSRTSRLQHAALLVSSDFNHDARSSISEALLTKISGRLLALSWYDTMSGDFESHARYDGRANERKMSILDVEFTE